MQTDKGLGQGKNSKAQTPATARVVGGHRICVMHGEGMGGSVGDGGCPAQGSKA